ncbi:MAG: hypothetical protein Q9192_009150 [Flavoplaca navasiana]
MLATLPVLATLASSHCPDREEQERAEQERAEQEARDTGSKSPSRVGAPAKVAGGAGAGIVGQALEDLIDGIDESQNTDRVAEELRTKVSEQYPGYNVMVIQQETYDEPENIQEVQTNFTESIGDNIWDVWVIESGTFTNTGDLGYKNWNFAGNYDRTDEDGNPDKSGNTVTFEPIEETEEPAPEETEQAEEQPEPLDTEQREDFLKGIHEPWGSTEYAKELMERLRERYPGENVMVIQQETYDEPENLQGTVETFPIAGQFNENPWDVWVGDSGTFTNTGDLGYKNWNFAGNYDRTDEDGNPKKDGNTVTFEPIEQ